MSDDWIKMRCSLHTHPKVVRISSALKADRFRTVGGLHAVWSLFDAHSTDGGLVGYTMDAIDDLIGWPGFSAAMKSVAWLEENTQGIVLPRFDQHNGKSAKRRANDVERKRSERSPHPVRNLSASDADISGTKSGPEKEKEKEKEEEQKLLASPAEKPAEEPDLIWSHGLAWMKSKGVPEGKARGAIGLAIKETDRLTVAELIQRAESEDIVEPVAWLIAAVKHRKAAGAQLSLVPSALEPIKASHRPLGHPRNG